MNEEQEKLKMKKKKKRREQDSGVRLPLVAVSQTWSRHSVNVEVNVQEVFVEVGHCVYICTALSDKTGRLCRKGRTCASSSLQNDRPT